LSGRYLRKNGLPCPATRPLASARFPQAIQSGADAGRDEIGVDWSRFDLEQFRAGMDVEFEHGSHDSQTDVTGDDPILTGKIALGT
jgi:Protein of unknown function (DUF5661)